MPPPLTWHISQTIVDCFFPIVNAYVLDQFHGHWLLSDALHFAKYDNKSLNPMSVKLL